jgi:hypothetical protein
MSNLSKDSFPEPNYPFPDTHKTPDPLPEPNFVPSPTPAEPAKAPKPDKTYGK